MAKAAVLEKIPEPVAAPEPAPAVGLIPAPVAVVPVAVVAPPKNYRILERDVKRADESVRWHVVVSPLVPYDAILNDRAFWGNVARPKGMQIGNIIEVHCADNSYFAELYILDVGAVWAKVSELRKVEFEKQSTAGDADIPGYTYSWDRIQKHHIVRDKDKQVIGFGFSSRSEAQSHLVDFVQRMGR